MANTVAVLTLLFLTALAAAELGSSGDKKDVAPRTWAIIDHEFVEFTQEELDWMKDREDEKDGRR